MEVSELTERAEQCHRELALEYFNAFSGISDQLNVVAILERYPELSSRETYDMITGLGEAEIQDARERNHLHRMVASSYLMDQLKVQNEQLANSEGDAVVRLGEEEFPYRALPVVLANEADYGKRGRLDAAYIAKLDSFNPLREEIAGLTDQVVSDLGFQNVIDFCEKVHGMRIYPLREILGRFMSETDEIYEARLARQADALPPLSREKLRHADVGYMMRAREYDGMFPANDMVPALARTLKGLGIELEQQENVTLDLDKRPKKSPRAFCISIDSPWDVRLVLLPRGGQNDFSTLFHEAGHLEFSAHMAADLPYFYRQHGDVSVHESYAFLLQHLVDDPVWWREIMHADPGGYPGFARFHRLYFFRRYSAKLHYEMEYYEQGGGSALAEVYSRWLERGCGFAYPRERYLSDFDAGFYVTQYLQAWIWEVQLRAYLKGEFGEAWFLKREAGDFLRDLWRDGMKYDVWEIAERLGLGGLDIAPLQAELTA